MTSQCSCTVTVIPHIILSKGYWPAQKLHYGINTEIRRHRSRGALTPFHSLNMTNASAMCVHEEVQHTNSNQFAFERHKKYLSNPLNL